MDGTATWRVEMDTTCSHERVHPLLLPDILIPLGSLLSKQDLFNAILVCRCWNNVLNHHLWKQINVGIVQGVNGSLCKEKHLYGLERHLHLIRSLETKYQPASIPVSKVRDPKIKALEERFKTMLTGCQGLTELSTSVLYEDLFMMLDKNRETITRFGWLSNVYEKDIQDQHATQRLWDVLSDDTDTGGMKHLKHLKLEWITIQVWDGHSTLRSAFTKLCERLETLELGYSTLTNWPISMSGVPQDKGNGDSSLPMFWNLRRVAFNDALGNVAHYERFLSQCPLLEHLTWSFLAYQEKMTSGFLWYLAQSRLKFLEIRGISLSDKFLAQVIRHLPSTFTTLAIPPSAWIISMKSVAATAALTLPSLSLVSTCDAPLKLSCDIVQQLFSSCTCLVRLDVRPCTMKATDLTADPWIVSRLVKLDLLITSAEKLDTCVDPTCTCGGDGTCGGRQSIIYEQLSRLVSLEDLSLAEGVIRYTPFDGPRIDFSLRHGMGKLVTLERLRRLDIRKLEGLKMGLEEGAWIRDNWPALQHLIVHHFEQDNTIHDNLMSYLHENRPKLWITQT
ncbi:hypothetical protein B0O80DRAFT_260385 [Mortierella sp. GBAus27b]|nr:hypothetical protein B0O80DRAFT_260385 [Mortierella sp. GBAus27b]